MELSGTKCLKVVAVAEAEVRVVTDSASASKVDGDIFMVHRSYTTIVVARFNLFVKKGLFGYYVLEFVVFILG